MSCTHYKPSGALRINVFHIDLYRPVWAVRIGLPYYWYADCPLPSGTAEIDCRRSISAIGNRLREKKGRRRRRRGKEERRKKKEERRGEEESIPRAVAARGSSVHCSRPWVAHASSPPLPVGRPRAVAALALSCDFSPVRGERLSIPLSTDGMYWSDKEPVWVVHYPHVHMSLKSLDVSRGFDGVPVFQVGSLEDVLKKMEVRKLFVEHTNIKLLQNLILLQTDYRLMTRILGGMI
ncbi:hypothetical protein BHE74_00041984 [Ensete ventricosum]|nr:hypothetical protein BHE74_00041984 [Ensete ventricosum]